METLYIVPAWSDQAGQCRIVSRITDGKVDASKDYRRNPALWKEAGLMNSLGQIVWLTANKDLTQDVIDSQPLMAGTQFSL
jgi:hypothetical protein